MLKAVVFIFLLLGLVYGDSGCQGGWTPKTLIQLSKPVRISVEIWRLLIRRKKTLTSRVILYIMDLSRLVSVVPNGVSQFWLGGQDVNGDGSWTWTDGSSFVYSDWAAGQPSNMLGDNCLLVDGISLLWSSVQCSKQASYLCETAPGSSSSCPKGQLCHGSYSYQLIGTLKDWHSAELFCSLLGGHLASVHNSAVQNIVEKLLAATDRNRAWLGARIKSSTLTWTDGTASDYSKWDNGNSAQVDSCVSKSNIHKKAFFNYKYFRIFSDIHNGLNSSQTPVVMIKTSDQIATYWLGGQDVNSNGSWTWTDGSAFNYNNWAAGGGVAGQDCLLLESPTALWQPSDCQKKANFICETEIPSIATTLTTTTVSTTTTSTTTTIPTTTTTQYCGGDFCIDGYQYYLSGMQQNWPDAQQSCPMYGNLASVHSAQAEKLLENYVGYPNFAVWIGGVYDRDFHWSDGTAVNYTNWLPGQPSIVPGAAIACVAVSYDIQSKLTGWGTFDCDSFSLFSVCSAPN
uniref:C-type lectin domain-containing protein n=1 Tax=Steinernema glaseri TaxID=37863 RepID=A0A1I7YQV9_9BILA